MSPKKTAGRRTHHSSNRSSRKHRAHRAPRPAPGGGVGPTYPDPYLPMLSVRDADWLRAEMLRAVGRRYPGTRLSSPTSLWTPQGASLGLRRPATMLASTERRLWGEAVEHHVATLMSATGPDGLPRGLADYDDQELLTALRLRLVPTDRGMACEADEPELVPGIRLTHVLDLHGLLITVPSSELFARLGEEATEPAALSNSRQVIDRVRHSEPGHVGLHLIESESMLTAGLALTLAEVCERFHIARPPLGHLVAVPEQECLLIVPVEGARTAEAFSRIVGGAVDFYERAEHPLSPLCFHVSADGAWVPVSQLTGSALSLAPDLPPGLAQALGLAEAAAIDGRPAQTTASTATRAAGTDPADGIGDPLPSDRREEDLAEDAAEAARAILYGRLADLVEEHGEDLTEEALDAAIEQPIDLMVRTSPRAGGEARHRSRAFGLPTADDALERLAAQGEPGLRALMHLARRQAETTGIDLGTLFDR